MRATVFIILLMCSVVNAFVPRVVISRGVLNSNSRLRAVTEVASGKDCAGIASATFYVILIRLLIDSSSLLIHLSGFNSATLAILPNSPTPFPTVSCGA